MRRELMKVLEKHAQGGGQLTDASHLIADLGIDSLGQMEVIADLEDAFKLTIPDEALREIETIGDVVRAVTTRLAAAGRMQG